MREREVRRDVRRAQRAGQRDLRLLLGDLPIEHRQLGVGRLRARQRHGGRRAVAGVRVRSRESAVSSSGSPSSAFSAILAPRRRRAARPSPRSPLAASASCACSTSSRGALPTSNRACAASRARVANWRSSSRSAEPGFGDQAGEIGAANLRPDIDDGPRQLGFADLKRRLRDRDAPARACRQARAAAPARTTASAFPFRFPRALPGSAAHPRRDPRRSIARRSAPRRSWDSPSARAQTRHQVRSLQRLAVPRVETERELGNSKECRL